MAIATNRKSQIANHQSPDSLRIGFGNDVHRLVAGRKLVLGGVTIPFDKGPLGHSDGDALAHAVCDALLGAAALGDIGRHFPDTAPEWRGASSLTFLRHIRGLLAHESLAIVNLDATIEIEQPRLASHIESMRGKIARALGIQTRQVNIKAKSGEGMGEVGRGEAVRAEAVVLLRRE
jgi:2-C-methyl-D-erythritol 2,4-cyclodiphosphate synthase